MLRKFLLLSGAALASLSLMSVTADEDVISNVMKKFHKAPEGEDPLCKKAGNGDATEAELASLLAAYVAIAAIDPPQGDAGSWKEKTDDLILAVQALQAGGENATEDYKAAVNCKSCHSVHKP